MTKYTEAQVEEILGFKQELETAADESPPTDPVCIHFRGVTTRPLHRTLRGAPMTETNGIGLWRKNRITGYWVIERKCAPDMADRWLKYFRQNQPDEEFRLSKRRPRD